MAYWAQVSIMGALVLGVGAVIVAWPTAMWRFPNRLQPHGK